MKSFTFTEVNAFIKDIISPTSMPNMAKINQGSLSDCEKYKLEVRTNDLRDMTKFEEGFNVLVTGIIKWGRTKDTEVPYLWVQKMEDIEVIKTTPPKDFYSLVLGYKTLARSMEEKSKTNVSFIIVVI